MPVTFLVKEDLPSAIDDALEKAKASGEFKGEPGKDGKDGADGAPGKDGQPGKDYVLTEDDKTEIAGIAAEMVEVPEGGPATPYEKELASGFVEYVEGTTRPSIDFPELTFDKFYAGQTLIVYDNGTRYEGKLEELASSTGNPGLGAGDPFTDDFPFTILLASDDENGLGIVFRDTLSHEVRVCLYEKLPMGALPDGFGNVPSDWNAPEGEPGHVLNRTHWVEDGELVEILPETQVAIYNNGSNEGYIGSPFNLTIGESYIVNLSGTEYKCNCIDAKAYDEAWSGVPGLIPEGTDLTTGEGITFGVVCFTEPIDGVIYGAVIFADKPTEATIHIYQKIETVHKLDPKFLPEDYINGLIRTALSDIPKWTGGSY